MWPLMSAPESGSSDFRTARADFWCIRCRGAAVCALNVSSRNVTPTPFVPPTSFSVAGVHGFAFHHLGKQSQPDADDFTFFCQTGDRLFDEVFCSFVVSLI